MSVKIEWNTVGKAAKDACGLALGFLVLSVIPSVVKVVHVSDHSNVTSSAGYGEAVNAIVNSKDISTWYKDDLLDKLERNRDESHYKAVISIVNNHDISTWYKADMIEKISEK